MRQRGSVGAGLLMGMALLGGARVEAADGTAAEAKNEVVVFGGASILDASRGQDQTIGIPGWGGDRWPDFPDIQVRTETSLGGSALFGARYSRYVKGRLAVEADFAVAPTHDLEVGGELCLEGQCYGRGMGDRMRGRWGSGPGRGLGDVDFDDFRTRNVTAWHYGGRPRLRHHGRRRAPVRDLRGGRGLLQRGRGGLHRLRAALRGGAQDLFGRVGARVDVVDHLVTEHFLSGDAEHDIHATAGFLVRF